MSTLGVSLGPERGHKYTARAPTSPDTLPLVIPACLPSEQPDFGNHTSIFERLTRQKEETAKQ